MEKAKKVEPTKSALVREVEAKLGFKKFELNSLERANKATIVALLVRQFRQPDASRVFLVYKTIVSTHSRGDSPKHCVWRGFVFVLRFCTYSFSTLAQGVRASLNGNENHSYNETHSAFARAQSTPGPKNRAPASPLFKRLSGVAPIELVEMILILAQGVLAHCVLL